MQMHARACVNAYKCVHVHIYVYVCHTCGCIRCVQMCECTHMQGVHMCVSLHLCANVCTTMPYDYAYQCTHVWANVCVCVYTCIMLTCACKCAHVSAHTRVRGSGEGSLQLSGLGWSQTPRDTVESPPSVPRGGESMEGVGGAGSSREKLGQGGWPRALRMRARAWALSCCLREGCREVLSNEANRA